MKRLFVAHIAERTPLSAEQRHYLRDVLRLADGEEIEIFDGRGTSFRATLQGEALRVGERLPAAKAGLDVVLVQALARGEKMDLVVQKATELGAARIVPLLSERATVRIDPQRCLDPQFAPSPLQLGPRPANPRRRLGTRHAERGRSLREVRARCGGGIPSPTQ